MTLDAFNTDVQEALAEIEDYAGQSVTVFRGADNFTATAVPGQTGVQRTDESGATVREFVQDFLIDAADYDFGSGAVEPLAGDEIERTIAGVTTRYEVAPPPGGDREWRYSGQGRTRYRIHTREISTA